jgi:hypothetical protein
MSSNFEKTESHVSQALKEHPDSTHAFSNELHDLQRCETKGAFNQDMTKLNDDLHKQGLLPGLQIVENEKTHEFELKKIADANNQKAPEKAAPADSGPEGQRQAPPEHGGGEHHGHQHHDGGHGGHGGHDGGHGGHHGRHHRHHKHHSRGKGGEGHDKDGAGDDNDNGNGNGKPDASEGKNDKGAPGQDNAGRSSDGSKVPPDGSNMSKDEKEKYIFNRLTDNHEGGLHLTNKQAAGVIGSLEGESPHLYSGYTDHKHEHDLGFVNWIKGRKRALQDFAKGQGKDPTDFKTQVDFMVGELKNGEDGKLHDGHHNGARDVLADLKQTHSVAEAARVFTSEYERPGIPRMKERLKNAELAFSRIGNWGNPGNQINDGVSPVEVAEIQT